MRRFAILLLGLLAACVPGRAPVPPLSRLPPGTTEAALIRQCIVALDRVVARYTPVDDVTRDDGCGYRGAVVLRKLSVPVAGLGPIACPAAHAFVAWAQNDVPAAARTAFGQEVARIETYGTYACRPINGVPGGRLSEHARANAVDIAAVVLASGRRVRVIDGWNGAPDEAGFWRAVHDAGCRRFGTVLGPDYNAAHRDHLHFDLGRRPGAFCR